MRAALVLALLASVLLGGCADPEPAADPDPVEPCLVRSATDDSCNDPAANGTVAERPHLHDYWQGKDRLVLEDVALDVGPFLCTDLAEIALLRPADGDTIIQGTIQVEATIAWTPPAAADPAGTPELWIKTAEDNEPWEAGPVENGATVTVESTNSRNDLPHQRLSAWEFRFMMRPDNPTGCVRYQGTVSLHLEIVRGLDIPLYPGHPDRWENRTVLPLLDHARSTLVYVGGTSGACLEGAGEDGGCLWDPHIPDDGAIVPNDAEVRVSLSSTDGTPLRVRLGYHGADSREIQWPDPVDDDGATRAYSLLAAGHGDGPYAKQSQWELRLVPDAPSEPAYTGSYQIVAEAHQVPE